MRKSQVIVASAAQQKAAKIKAAFTDGNSAKNQYYTAKSITPAITVMNSDSGNPRSSDETGADQKLEKGVDYVISYPADTTNVGTKKVTITGTSAKCIGTATLSYSIKPAKTTDAFLKAVLMPGAADKDGYDFVSTGVTVGDDLKVSYQYKGAVVGTTLTEGVDYKVTYSNNKKAGSAGYVVTGLGNYKGLKTDKQYFTIKGLVLSNKYKSDVAGQGIQLIVGDKVYTKKAVYQSVPSLVVNGELVKPSEYTVSYRMDENADWKTKPDKIELGEDENSKTVYVKVSPKPNKINYFAADTGEELTASYHVVRAGKKDLSGAKIILQDKEGKTAKVVYTGTEVKPYKAVIENKGISDITIILDGDHADYAEQGFKVTYANNTLKGKATAVIEATEDNARYTGSKAAAFSIVLKNFNTASFIKALLNIPDDPKPEEPEPEEPKPEEPKPDKPGFRKCSCGGVMAFYATEYGEAYDKEEKAWDMHLQHSHPGETVNWMDFSYEVALRGGLIAEDENGQWHLASDILFLISPKEPDPAEPGPGETGGSESGETKPEVVKPSRFRKCACGGVMAFYATEFGELNDKEEQAWDAHDLKHKRAGEEMNWMDLDYEEAIGTKLITEDADGQWHLASDNLFLISPKEPDPAEPGGSGDTEPEPEKKILSYDMVSEWATNIKVEYTGEAVEPKIELIDKEVGTLVEDVDYTLSYQNNVEVSDNAKIIVTGKGKYTGSIEIFFSIIKTEESKDDVVKPTEFYICGGCNYIEAAYKQGVIPEAFSDHLAQHSYNGEDTQYITVSYENAVKYELIYENADGTWSYK